MRKPLSHRTRLILGLMGAALIVISLIALTYAQPEPARVREQMPVAATLMTPPVEEGQ